MPREDTCFALCTLYPPDRASKHGRDVELQAARYSGRPAGLKTDIVKERKNTAPPRNTQTPENKSSIVIHRATKLPSERVTETQKGADKHKRILEQSYIHLFTPQKWIRHLLCAGTGR